MEKQEKTIIKKIEKRDLMLEIYKMRGADGFRIFMKDGGLENEEINIVLKYIRKYYAEQEKKSRSILDLILGVK